MTLKRRKEQQQQQQQKLRQLQRHSRIRPKTDSHLNHAKIKAQAQAQVKVKTTTKTKLRSKTTDRNSSINNALISLIPLPQLLKLGYRLSLTVVTDSHQQQTLNDTLIDDSIDNNDISNSNSRNFLLLHLQNKLWFNIKHKRVITTLIPINWININK